MTARGRNRARLIISLEILALLAATSIKNASTISAEIATEN
ncbi:hypothetical protein [Anaerofustis stercorihominis]